MGVTEIAGETRENRSKRFGHVLREETMMGQSKEDKLIRRRRKSERWGRPKKRRNDTNRKRLNPLIGFARFSHYSVRNPRRY